MGKAHQHSVCPMAQAIRGEFQSSCVHASGFRQILEQLCVHQALKGSNGPNRHYSSWLSNIPTTKGWKQRYCTSTVKVDRVVWMISRPEGTKIKGPVHKHLSRMKSHLLHVSSKNLGRSSHTSVPTTALPGATNSSRDSSARCQHER